MTSHVHPMPLPPSEHQYGIHFVVPAETYLEAVNAAVAKLRRDVHLIGVQSAVPNGRCLLGRVVEGLGGVVMGVDYSTLPEHMRQGAEDYIERGYKPGSFLYAVLTNDLVEAFGHADDSNLAAMHTWAKWLYNEAPRTCWGSPERVAEWLAALAQPDPDTESPE